MDPECLTRSLSWRRKARRVVRPRTTGELLDDAWRLYFADAPMLLLFSGVFLAPAFGALLLAAALPVPADPLLRLLMPLLPLILLVLTGLGSGACQEWFRARSEGKSASFTKCLNAAGRRGLSHTAARAVALTGSTRTRRLADGRVAG